MVADWMTRPGMRFPSPVTDSPTFTSPRAAVELIGNGAAVAAVKGGAASPPDEGNHLTSSQTHKAEA